jgi:hypothetical protein
MQSRAGVMRVRRLEKEENVRTLVKKNDSQVMNEKRYETPVRSKDIEDAVRAGGKELEEKENIIGTLTKKKNVIVLTTEKRREGQLKEKKSWKIQGKTRGL